MLVSREEMRFDFKEARFDLRKESDRKLLGWIFNQFLYGEVTGIQCGHWLYQAPHLNAAVFLAKQASEELSHVRKILRILSLMGEKPGPAHWAIRFLSTEMMGKSWGEHVTLEMALGEGLVLGVFYAMADTIEHPEIRKILETATLEEERHVEFGERETQAWLEHHPETRGFLLGSALLQIWILLRFRGFIIRRLAKDSQNPILAVFPEFYDHAVKCFELRVERLGLSQKRLSELGGFEKLCLMVCVPIRQFASRFKRRKPLLTSTYLDDPMLKTESRHFHPE